MTAIKICGIRTPEIASLCGDLGAQYIGLIFCKTSPRYVEIKDASLIAAAAFKKGITPVAVFTDADANTIIDTCEQTGITHVQLHGDISRQVLKDLPKHLHIIYVMTPMTDISDVLSHLRTLDDFILLDSATPGIGKAIDWDHIQVPSGYRFFLAGGLNADNVQMAITACHPYGVDVSSGVEKTRGVKSPELIAQFIENVKEEIKTKKI